MSGSRLSSRSIAAPPRQQLFNPPERRLLLPKGEFRHLRRWHHGSLVPPPKRTAPTCFLAAALLDELPEERRAWRYSDEPVLIFVFSTAILCLHPEDEAALPRAGAPQAGPTATSALPAGQVTAGPSSRCRPSTAAEALLRFHECLSRRDFYNRGETRSHLTSYFKPEDDEPFRCFCLINRSFLPRAWSRRGGPEALSPLQAPEGGS